MVNKALVGFEIFLLFFGKSICGSRLIENIKALSCKRIASSLI